jgi:hypothetical protein
MENQENFKMLDLIKYSNSFNLGWRFSKYENSKRMISVIKNIAQHNKGDSFAEGLLQGFTAGRSQNPTKQKRNNELDIIFSSKEQEKEKGEPER